MQTMISLTLRILLFLFLKNIKIILFLIRQGKKTIKTQHTMTLILSMEKREIKNIFKKDNSKDRKIIKGIITIKIKTITSSMEAMEIAVKIVDLLSNQI